MKNRFSGCAHGSGRCAARRADPAGVRWAARPSARRLGRAAFAAVTLIALAALSCAAPVPVSFTGELLPVEQVGSTTVRILAFGDQGDAGSAQVATAASMTSIHQTAPFDFALVLGDNFYEVGVSGVDDPQFDTKFRDIYDASILDFPFYVVLGNHDYLGNDQAEYSYVDPDGRWRAPGVAALLPVELSDGYRISVYLVDSEVLVRRDAYADAVAGWVTRMLRSDSSDLRIFACHRPFYSSGMHGDTPELLYYFGRELSSGRIDVVLSGHDHDLELQSRDVDGDSDPELFVVSGAAARSRPITGGTASLFASDSYGFAVLSLSRGSTGITFYDDSASLLYP
ncbi:metallophosphoesterase [Salinispira pacifica]